MMSLDWSVKLPLYFDGVDCGSAVRNIGGVEEEEGERLLTVQLGWQL